MERERERDYHVVDGDKRCDNINFNMFDGLMKNIIVSYGPAIYIHYDIRYFLLNQTS